MENLDWNAIVTFLLTLNVTWLPILLQVLGTVVIVATAVDVMLTKVAYMDKLYAVPVLGSFLKFVVKFSPFQYRQ